MCGGCARCSFNSPECSTAVGISFSLPLCEWAADTCTSFGPPWPDLLRPPTSSNAALSTAGKAWMPGPNLRLSGSAFSYSYTKMLYTTVQPLAPRGRTCSGHPRLQTSRYRQRGRRGWPGRARPRGSWVVPSSPQTTDFVQQDNRGPSSAKGISACVGLATNNRLHSVGQPRPCSVVRSCFHVWRY